MNILTTHESNTGTENTVQNPTTMSVDRLLRVSRNASIVFEAGELNNTITESGFSVVFPCSIDGKSYSIVLTGTARNIDNTPQFEGRESPLKYERIPSTGLNREWKIVTWLIRSDIHPNMKLVLKDRDDTIVENTSPKFWEELRNRIPATHPLSLIPQY